MAVTYPHQGRDNNFQLIRLCAASAVVLTHSFSIVTGRFDSEPLVQSLQRSIGHYAVDLFFVLSGFLVTQSLWRNPDIVRYFLARGFRIFPGLIAAALGAALIMGPLVATQPLAEYFGSPEVPRYIFGVISTVWVDGALPGVFIGSPESGNVNEPLWTLKYELAAYVSLAVAAFFVLRLGRWAPLYILAVLLGLYIYGRTQIPWPQSSSAFNNLIHLLMVFYLGAVIFLVRRSIPLTLPGLVAFWGLAILTHNTQFREISELLAIGYTFLWVAFVPDLARKKLAGGGDYSYGIYIYAYPIQQSIRMVFPEITPLELFAASMVCVLPVAAASWHLVEKPALNAGKAIISRRQARQATATLVASASAVNP